MSKNQHTSGLVPGIALDAEDDLAYENNQSDLAKALGIRPVEADPHRTPTWALAAVVLFMVAVGAAGLWYTFSQASPVKAMIEEPAPQPAATTTPAPR
jgi:hypothetical protein